MWMVLIGRRSTPSGSSSARVNIRSRICAASSCDSTAGSAARSQTISSFLFFGCGASGQTIASPPRSTGYMPETCRNGRFAPISASTASLRRSLRQNSHRRGCFVRIRRASRDRRAHVRQRVVRRVVHQTVRRAEVLELQRGLAVVVHRPLDAFGAQRPGAAHDVQQVPAAAAVTPLARVRVDQVAPEQVARDLVVEADRVVADPGRARPAEFALDRRRERVFGQATLEAPLRRDAGQQAGLGIGQRVGRGLAVQHHRRADLVQLGVGADAGELRRPVTARQAAEGFVVVPEEAEVGVGHAATIPQPSRATCATSPAPPSPRSAGTHRSCRSAPR